MKKTLTLLLALCLLSSFVSAEFSSQNAYNWLSAKADSDGSFNNNVAATAWAVLAMDKAGISLSAEHSLEWIFSQQSASYCFPSSPCKTKDTAMALLAMNALQRIDNMSFVQDALRSMIVPSSLSGKWFIEVSTGNSGSCKLSWEINNQTRDKTVAVDKGKFTEYSGSYFLDIESVSSSILRQPGTAIDVDCTGIEGSDVIITLLYRSSNKYYIVSSASANKAEVIVNNGCFGNGPGDSTCRKEPALYAAWAAKETGASIDVKVYLMDAYSDSGVEDNALLYLSTGEARYLEELKRIQKTDGSFDRSVMKTALAVLALSKDAAYSETASKAVEWLKTKQRADGSLGDVSETAAALYAAFSEPVEAPPSDYVLPEAICNDDGLCDYEAGEDSENCPEDCPAEEEPAPAPYGEECDNSGICDTDFGETSENCPEDCTCGDGKCDDYEDSEGSCDDDCIPGDEEPAEDEEQMQEEPSGGATKWIIIILVALIVIAGGIFAMKKMGVSKQKPKAGGSAYSFPRPTGMPPVSPSKIPPMKHMAAKSAFKPAAKSKDTELEKSLEEARKLLGK